MAEREIRNSLRLAFASLHQNIMTCYCVHSLSVPLTSECVNFIFSKRKEWTEVNGKWICIFSHTHSYSASISFVVI